MKAMTTCFMLTFFFPSKLLKKKYEVRSPEIPKKLCTQNPPFAMIMLAVVVVD